MLAGRYRRNEQDRNMGILDDRTYRLELNKITHALTSYVSDYLPNESSGNTQDNSFAVDPIPETSSSSNNSASFFISYSHFDKVEAEKVKAFLENKGISVLIDENSLQPGEDIKSFILQNIRKSAYTLCIISRNSLLSSWAMQEVVQSKHAEDFSQSKFIGAYIDGTSFDRQSVNVILDEVENEIQDIQNDITIRLKKGIGIEDLQPDLERLKNLKHNLPKIIKWLRGSYIVNIQEDSFTSGMEKIADLVQK